MCFFVSIILTLLGFCSYFRYHVGHEPKEKELL